MNVAEYFMILNVVMMPDDVAMSSIHCVKSTSCAKNIGCVKSTGGTRLPDEPRILKGTGCRQRPMPTGEWMEPGRLPLV